MLDELDDHLFNAAEHEQHIILDLAKTAYLGPDALASLLHTSISLSQSNRLLLLAEMPVHLVRVFRTAQLKHCFLTAPSVGDAIYRINKGESRLPSELVSLNASSAAKTVHVQVEMLKDFCERIIAVGQASQFLFDSRSSATPTPQ